MDFIAIYKAWNKALTAVGTLRLTQVTMLREPNLQALLLPAPSNIKFGEVVRRTCDPGPSAARNSTNTRLCHQTPSPHSSFITRCGQQHGIAQSNKRRRHASAPSVWPIEAACTHQRPILVCATLESPQGLASPVFKHVPPSFKPPCGFSF